MSTCNANSLLRANFSPDAEFGRIQAENFQPCTVDNIGDMALGAEAVFTHNPFESPSFLEGLMDWGEAGDLLSLLTTNDPLSLQLPPDLFEPDYSLSGDGDPAVTGGDITPGNGGHNAMQQAKQSLRDL
ncbi:hypothetical protein LTR95_015790, partial [Oleoguttula sp. CCFEE 5521]